MKTQAIRLYGKKDLRLDTFDLPEIKDNEILATIVSDSICMSSYKAAIQGADHKRVPSDIDKNPVIVGHEFCGELTAVGDKWKHNFKPGQRFAIQPALNYKGSLDAPGYSYRFIGGAATNIIIPNEVMEMDCLLPYNGDAFFYGSLSEPMSCIVGAMRASYHVPQGTYDHKMGIKPQGNMAVLAGAGPMGLGLIDLSLHGNRSPALLLVTDIDDERLRRAESLFPVAGAAKYNIRLVYLNTGKLNNPDNPAEEIKKMLGIEGFDDVFVMAPVSFVVEQADRLLAKDGCMNFFAGPSDPDFSAKINFYDLHYAFHHFTGTSGGNTEDMKIAIRLMEQSRINPATMVTHIGGLNAVADTILNLPDIPGGKKLIYTHINMALTAIDEFKEMGKNNFLFRNLAELIDKHNGLWNKEAEDLLLQKADPVL